MAKILYGVSPIGLGHATRAVAIGLILRAKGADVEFATGGNACSFMRSYGFSVHDIVTAPTPSEKKGVMKSPGLWYLRYWSGYRSTRPKMNSLVATLKPKLIVGDEEFSSLSLAIEQKIENVMISDELQLAFAQGRFSRFIERRVSSWYTQLQARVSYLLVPDFGKDHGNVHFMEPVVRAVTMTRNQVLASIGLAPDQRVILFSASGSGIGKFLLDAARESLSRLKLPNTMLVVTGLGEKPPEDGVAYIGTQRDNQNFVAAADLVISTAGKSTIDEAASYGSPIIAIPIKNHSEQERNAKSLGYSYEDMGRLDALIADRLGKRSAPKDYQGTENIASRILELA